LAASSNYTVLLSVNKGYDYFSLGALARLTVVGIWEIVRALLFLINIWLMNARMIHDNEPKILVKLNLQLSIGNGLHQGLKLRLLRGPNWDL